MDSWRAKIVASYCAQVGPHWVTAGELDGAPFVVLCHGVGPDPVFVYANECACRLWERPLHEFLGWPSRLTAPPGERQGRAAALAGNQVVRDYAGIRISATGRLFRIQDAIVWPVADDAGTVVGQAATFSSWHYL